MLRKIILIIIDILAFTFVSLLVSQIPTLIHHHHTFFSTRTVILSVIAGVASGLIVGLFNLLENKGEK